MIKVHMTFLAENPIAVQIDMTFSNFSHFISELENLI